jgi:hypothetical protein
MRAYPVAADTHHGQRRPRTSTSATSFSLFRDDAACALPIFARWPNRFVWSHLFHADIDDRSSLALDAIEGVVPMSNTRSSAISPPPLFQTATLASFRTVGVA